MKISEMSCVEIVRALKDLGCTDQWIADEIGINRGTVKRIRDGQPPRSRVMVTMARAVLRARLDDAEEVLSRIERDPDPRRPTDPFGME